ncbi:MAG: hypothetical protein Q4C47_08385 [Planctomycetia bacterium]|nr:hypothetical protein [Planctomycetia bacterium]
MGIWTKILRFPTIRRSFSPSATMEFCYSGTLVRPGTLCAQRTGNDPDPVGVDPPAKNAWWRSSGKLPGGRTEIGRKIAEDGKGDGKIVAMRMVVGASSPTMAGIVRIFPTRGIPGTVPVRRSPFAGGELPVRTKIALVRKGGKCTPLTGQSGRSG